MSNITLFKGNLPAYIRNAELDETTKSLLSAPGGGKRISIKGGVFRMVVNGEEVSVNEDRAMNIVVVKAAPTVSRTYYQGQYKEGENLSPVCWSADGVKPADAAPKKQCDTCAKCEQNVKGSGQGDTRACRFNRKLAVVLDGDLEGDVYELSLPATSIFGKADGDKMPLNAYVQALAAHNVPVTAVVTEMRFDTKSPVPKLFFKPIRPLSEEEWVTCKEQGETTEAAQAVTVNFTVKEEEGDEEFEQVVKAAKKTTKKPEPKPEEPEDEAEEAAEDEADDEPVKVEKKKAKPAPTEEADDDLESLIDEWS